MIYKMGKNTLESVREFFNNEWNKSSEDIKRNFKGHFEGVLKYAKMLGKGEAVDMEVLEISVLLHDVSTLRGDYEEHHMKGAEIAEKLLKELNYPIEKIEKVKHCILSHRGSKKIKRETKEAQILADADALCHFDEIDALFNAYKDKNKVLEKLNRSYDKLSNESKIIVKDKFEKLKSEMI